MYKDVVDFHIAFNLPVREKPMLPSDEERHLRIRLLEEEFNEYLLGEENDDLENIAKELADIIYIASGTAAAYGIPLDKVFKEVHDSNMAKLVDGKPIYREDGKVLKPTGWKAPDIKQFIDV